MDLKARFTAPEGMTLDQAELMGQLVCRSCGCSATMHDPTELSICARNLEPLTVDGATIRPASDPYPEDGEGRWPANRFEIVRQGPNYPITTEGFPSVEMALEYLARGF